MPSAGRVLTRVILSFVVVAALAGCSIESHDSRLDHCLKGHDEVEHHAGQADGTIFVCDEYDLPLKEGK